MAYLSAEQLSEMGFRFLGRDVVISDKAVFYNPSDIAIGDNSRIDDFCVIAGKVDIGRFVHIAVFSNVAGGRAGVTLADFSGLAYGCHIVAQSDDYSGATMTNPQIPSEFKGEISEPVIVGRYAILGAGSVVLPGVTVAEGTASGALTLLNKPTDEWSIYVGSPARKLCERSRALLDLADRFAALEGLDT